jgi:hypothetical protein
MDPRMASPNFVVFSKVTISLFSRRRTEVQSHGDSVGATVSGLVVGGEEIGVGTGSVTRLAGSRRAVTRVVGGNSKAGCSECGVAAHVDARKIPVDGGLDQGVLVLQDVRLVLGGGHLDGDTATVGVEAPILRVTFSARGQSDHIAVGRVTDRPKVDGLVHVIDDADATASAGGGAVSVTGLNGGRNSSGQCAKGGEGSESVGEHHCEKNVDFNKR